MHIVVWRMFLGHFSKRNPLLWTMNVYLRRIKQKKHRSGHPQVIKGQLSYSYKYGNLMHFIYLFLKCWLRLKMSPPFKHKYSAFLLKMFYFTCITTVRFVRAMAETKRHWCVGVWRVTSHNVVLIGYFPWSENVITNEQLPIAMVIEDVEGE